MTANQNPNLKAEAEVYPAVDASTALPKLTLAEALKRGYVTGLRLEITVDVARPFRIARDLETGAMIVGDLRLDVPHAVAFQQANHAIYEGQRIMITAVEAPE